MTMKMKAAVCALLFTIVLFAGNAGATVLPVPEVDQMASNWCWAACTQSVLSYYGQSVAQCTLAEELRVANSWYLPNNMTCCSSNAPQNYPSACNQSNPVAGYPGSITYLLAARNITSTGYTRAFTDNELSTQMNSGRPVIAAWSMASGSGHGVVCRGREVNQNNVPMVFFMDPSPNSNNYYVRTYDWFYSAPTIQNVQEGHTWVNSLAVTSSHSLPSTPSAQVSVNGVNGAYTARYGQFVNVTASLNPNGYTDNADWWVLMVINGTVYYQDTAGNWTTTPAIRTQGRLTSFSNYTIYSSTPPSGTYTIYFGVDLNPDGILNNPLYYSSAIITIQP